MEPSVFRYVGVSDNLVKRLRAHLTDHEDTYKCRWIRKILSEGRTPKLQVIHSVDTHEEAYNLEQIFIEVAKEQGHRLTNTTDGGIGIPNPSIETRTKIKTSMQAMWQDPKRRAKMIASMVVFTPTPEARAKMSASARARARTPEWSAKMVASLSNRQWSSESRAKVGAASRAYWARYREAKKAKTTGQE
jgi:predicted GIY-YIG superfamily endonuclease